MNIDKLDRSTVKMIRGKMQQVLDEAGIDGVEFEIGNARFSENEVTFKVVGKTAGAEEQANEQLQLFV